MEAGYLRDESTEVPQSVVGGFPTLTRARTVVRELREAGFPSEQISVVLSRARPETEPDGSFAPAVRLSSTVMASLVGGTVGLLLSSSFPALRRLDEISKAGPVLRVLVAGTAGVGIGALLGPVAKGLVSIWLRSRQPSRREAAEQIPGILVGATGRGERIDRAREILTRFGAEDLRTYGGAHLDAS